MVARETGLGVFASAVLALVALPLVACGDSKRASGPRGSGSGGSGGSSGSAGSGGSGGASGSTGSGGSGGSSGSAGGSQGGSNGVGGATGGSATAGSATAGSGGGAGTAGAAGSGDAGGGGTGGDEESASFHWIEATDEHRARAASSPNPASLRTYILPPYDAPVVVGTSGLTIDAATLEIYEEGFVWTEATGTTALGRLPGVTPAPFIPLSYPTGISADGSVVVGTAVNSERGYVPFRWTRADGLEAIAEVGGAAAVSEDGSVVLGVQDDQRLFRWTRELGAVTIVERLDGDDKISALALSADGATVLGQSYLYDNSAAHLLVWTDGSGTRTVENLPGFARCSVEFTDASRSNGFVTVGSCSNETEGEIFLWSGQDRLMALGPADALGGHMPGFPSAVTADGAVAVGPTYGDDESHVYRWTEANGFELIELPQGYTNGTPARFPEAMSEDGSVVVGTMGGSATHAFLWSERAGAVVLSPLEGHDTSEALVVSADGSVAAGTSRLGTENPTAVYWRADGVAHHIADELVAGGVDLGGGALGQIREAQASLGFFGFGSKDEVSTSLGWRARLR